MNRITAITLLIASAAWATPAHAGEEWKWGVNFYDLQIRSAVEVDSAIESDICSAALTNMASLMLDEDPDSESTSQLIYLAGVWKQEGANRRETDLETYTSKYMLPAFTLIDNLEDDDHTYWVQTCLDRTRKYVE